MARTARHTWKSALEMLLSWKLRADLLATRAKGGVGGGTRRRERPPFLARTPPILPGRMPPTGKTGLATSHHPNAARYTREFHFHEGCTFVHARNTTASRAPGPLGSNANWQFRRQNVALPQIGQTPPTGPSPRIEARAAPAARSRPTIRARSTDLKPYPCLKLLRTAKLLLYGDQGGGILPEGLSYYFGTRDAKHFRGLSFLTDGPPH